ncbi:hypothetical protein IMG5_061170 [Ichthyophthirius multifiliis]|uniref:Cyclin n=1 Tax=Ichthyophthirius multifiliis TaxID=5932 RepID=G0QNS7_ICHMU|nr:hypothetical protein IMG5_061170 [Ichthyophthirius multifiliis]EGR33118.1 hypothetical protein IMG5_061170 [Ichthyophthirius multifiliis]|eukprot:XP_004037104.1 hypothetical protein IMG5_061170 [Ichthyophthirius multifiliis]
MEQEEQVTAYIDQTDNISYEEAYIINRQQILHTEDILNIIANVLQEIIQQTDNQPIEFLTNFHGQNIPNISIKDYLLRISRCTNCSQECFILALIYIDRITQRHKKFNINSYNIHRILICSIMVAIKFFDDKYYNNEYYSKVGGITNQEINQLERDFLQLINFKLHCRPELFFTYRGKIIISQEANKNEMQE